MGEIFFFPKRTPRVCNLSIHLFSRHLVLFSWSKWLRRQPDHSRWSSCEFKNYRAIPPPLVPSWPAEGQLVHYWTTLSVNWKRRVDWRPGWQWVLSLDLCGRKWLWPSLSCYGNIYPVRLRKTQKPRNTQCRGREPNLELLELHRFTELASTGRPKVSCRQHVL